MPLARASRHYATDSATSLVEYSLREESLLVRNSAQQYWCGSKGALNVTQSTLSAEHELHPPTHYTQLTEMLDEHERRRTLGSANMNIHVTQAQMVQVHSLLLMSCI